MNERGSTILGPDGRPIESTANTEPPKTTINSTDSAEGSEIAETEWLTGGSPEQRRAVNEALDGLLGIGVLDRKLFDALMTGAEFSSEPIAKPALYENVEGQPIAYPDHKRTKIVFSQELNPNEPELRHAIAHETAHLAEAAINYDRAFDKFVAKRHPALDSKYVRAIELSITEHECETTVEEMKRDLMMRERFAEDYGAFFQSTSKEEFFLKRLERADEAELEAYFGDTKTVNELMRIVRDPSPERRQLPENLKKLKPIEAAVEESYQLFDFFTERTENIRGLDREGLTEYIEEQLVEGVEPVPREPIVDLDTLFGGGERKPRTSWLELFFTLIHLLFGERRET